MSIQQKMKPATDLIESKQPPLEQPRTTKERQSGKYGKAGNLLQALYRWLQASSFAPSWLPKHFRHPLIGYLMAILLQIIAVLTTTLLIQLYPEFAFAGLLEVLAIALVALNWGAGPSLMATAAGAVFLTFATLPPRFSLMLNNAQSIVQLLIFLLVGITISTVASQFERARRNSAKLAASLATERARLEAIIETVPDALSIHDAQGKIVQLNRAGRHNVGFYRGKETLTEAQSAYSVRTLTGKLLPLEEFPVARALHGETVANVELRFVNAEGQDTYALLSAAPLYDLQGQIDGAVLITHDISMLHQSEREAAIRASELEATFDAMADAVFLFNSDKDILHLNNAARELIAAGTNTDGNYVSLPAEERMRLLAMRDEHGQLLTEEQWPISRILNGEVLKGADAADVFIHTLNGREVALNVSGAPVRNQDGQLIGALCICRDVTERRQLERRTQDTLNALLTMAETLVLPPESSASTGQLPSTTEEHVLRGVSKVAQRLVELTCSVLGCKRVAMTAVDPETNELVSMAVVGLSPEEERLWRARKPGFRISDLLDGVTGMPPLSPNEVITIDMRQPAFSNMPNPYNISVMLIVPMSVGDQIVGILSLDYNGKKHEYTPEEIGLAKAVAKLAAFVIERERLLRERENARATELALREANRRMDEFLGMTSHELKTPLTSIKGNTQLAVRQLKNNLQSIQKMQTMFESTERQIKLLDRLINDLLDISRSETNQLELSLAPCDLATVVREVVEEQRRAWPTRTITLDLSDDTTAPIYGDTDRLNQVMTNYLTNALKYSGDDRPVHVTVQIERENVCVSVKDQGPGLSPEEQAHVWQRFYRVSDVEVLSKPQSAMTGMGLGLYISKTIIEQHHGQVGVRSTPNEGSTFWFSLPLAAQA